MSETCDFARQRLVEGLRLREGATPFFGLEVRPAMVDYRPLKVEGQLGLRLPLSDLLYRVRLGLKKDARERSSAEGFFLG